MPRTKKKHMKLPNGFGSIKKLSGNRRKPFAAYPPVTDYDDNGIPVSQPAIGYYEDWYQAYNALSEYNKNPYDLTNREITFTQVYLAFMAEKFNPNAKRKFSDSLKNSYNAAYKNSKPLHDKIFINIRLTDMQTCIDACPLKHASLELMVSLYHQLFNFARSNGITDKDYSEFLTINIPDDDEKGVPFSEEEISILWQNKDKDYVDIILIMIYSGFRISAYSKLEINMNEGYFKGGVKSRNSKKRIVPIYSGIKALVEKYKDSRIINCSSSTFRLTFKNVLDELGIATSTEGTVHTPHDCRHTFSWLCDKYKVDPLSKRLMLGHALGDLTDAKYGHRTLEELKEEIEKISCC